MPDAEIKQTQPDDRSQPITDGQPENSKDRCWSIAGFHSDELIAT